MVVLAGLVLQQFRTELEQIVGVEHVLAESDKKKHYSSDLYWLSTMWSEKQQETVEAQFVVFPSSTEEVSGIMRLATEYSVPVTVRGLGSGTQGGATALFGGIVLCLERMDRVINIDEKSLVLTAQPGINGEVLEKLLNERGLMLSHYPSSFAIASLGGYLAARGSGVMSTKYGKAEDMVLSIEVVLPDGKVMNSLPVPNHANGPGLLQLFVGSEGTLGVITEIKIRLDPIPEKRRFRAFTFPSVTAGLEAGRKIMLERLNPAVIRLYDEGASKRSLRDTGHDIDGVAMIVMVDGREDVSEIQMNRVIEISLAEGGTDEGEAEGEHWWEHRYDFYRPPLQPEYPNMYGTVETVTTFDKIEELYEAKRRHIVENYAEWGAKYTAHFSHWYPWGVMIYDRFYIDNPPQDPVESLRLHNKIWDECSRINLDIAGILNEHHGIGFKVGRLMREQQGEAFEVLLGIKKSIDPRGIMNPGKLGFGAW